MHKITGIVLLLLVLCGAAKAAPWYEDVQDLWSFYRANEWFEGKGQQQWVQAIRTLAQSGEPRQLAFAALLADDWARDLDSDLPAELTVRNRENRQPIAPPSVIQSWRQTALQRAQTDDVLLFAMLASFNHGANSSGQNLQQEALRRWQQAEADNLVPLLYAKLPAAELLQKAGTRGRASAHGYAVQRWMYRTLQGQLADAPQEGVALMVEGFWLGGAVPDFSSLLKTCRDPEAIAAEYAQDCRHIGEVLHEQSESLILRAIGIALLKKQATGAAELQVLDNERAHIRWLTKQRTGLSLLKAPRYALMVLQDPAINGEQQEIESILRLEGLPITESGVVAPES